MFKADKEKNIFLLQLESAIFGDVKDDETFLKRLLWANTYIAHQLRRFEDIYEEIG